MVLANGGFDLPDGASFSKEKGLTYRGTRIRDVEVDPVLPTYAVLGFGEDQEKQPILDVPLKVASMASASSTAQANRS